MKLISITYVLIAMIMAGSVQAQNIDLNTIPEDFSFVSRGHNGNATITYLGRDGELFKFQSDRDNSLGHAETLFIWTNRESQSIRLEWAEGAAKMSPHGCGPSLGECNFVVRHSSGTVSKRTRVTFMIGDVWVDRLYYIIEGQRVFQSQSCTTFDEFGFWIDYVRETVDGVMAFGQRVQSSVDVGETTSFEDLQDLCRDAEEFVS